MNGAGGVITFAVSIAMAMVLLTAFLTFIRLVLGPSLADRIVALELLGTISIGIVATYSLIVDQPGLLDAATVVALVAFLGTVAFAGYLQRSPRDE